MAEMAERADIVEKGEMTEREEREIVERGETV